MIRNLESDRRPSLALLLLLAVACVGSPTRAPAQENVPPLANANGPYEAPMGVAISFASTGSVDPDGTIVSYAWSFGDGAAASGPTASHAYSLVGAYTVTLTVVDDDGASATAMATVFIVDPAPEEPPPPPPPAEPPPPPPAEPPPPDPPPPPPPAEPPPPPPPAEPPPNEAPRANANGPYTGTVGVALQFSSAGSADADGTIASHRWMFGDGASATVANPTHVYSTPGSYTATLTVTDDDGATASTLATVTVAAPPNRAPTAAADSFRIDEDELLSVPVAQGVLANDSDPDGNDLSAGLVTDVTSGTLALERSGAFTFRPPREFSGTVTFVYRASDGTATSAPATVTIEVASSNDPPTGRVGEQTGTENLPLANPLDLASSFSDAEGDGISFTVTGLPPGLAATPAGLITGTPTIGTSVGEWTVRVVATDDGAPPAQSSSTFTWRVLTAGRADLALTAAVAPSTTLAGGAVTWSYVVDNPSQSNVANLALTVELAGGTFAPGALPAGCGPATPPASVECRVGPVAAGQKLAIELPGTAGPSGDVVATATVRIADPIPIDANAQNDTSRALLGVADSIGAAAQSLASDGHRASVVADFDGDGHNDLAVATDARSPVLIHANVPDPTNGRKRLLAATPTTAGDTVGTSALAAADFDADGVIDLVTAGDANQLLLNRTAAGGQIAFSTARSFADSGSVGVASGDFDGDGRADVVFAGAERAAYLNAGGAWTRAALPGDGAAHAVAVANLAGDMLPEIVVVGVDGNAAVYPNTGGTFGAPISLAVEGASAVVSGDFDGDGDIDLGFGIASTPDGSVPTNVVFTNTSTAAGLAFERGATFGAGTAVALAAHDIDANGTADIIVVRSGGSHSLYRNSGGAAFALDGARFESAGASAVAVGAVGADARSDIVVTGAGGTSVFFDDGRGRFGEGDTVAPVVTLNGPAVVDMRVDAPFQDPGATATDDVDGDLTALIKVEPPVDTALVGEQTVTYVVADASGNVAAPVTRKIRIDVNPPVGGGGGGALGALLAVLLTGLAALRRQRRRVLAA